MEAPTGGDNSSLLELWQFLLVLNPQELLEVLTSPSQSIYSCCVFPYSFCIYNTQLIPWWMQFPQPVIVFAVTSEDQLSSLLL